MNRIRSVSRFQGSPDGESEDGALREDVFFARAGTASACVEDTHRRTGVPKNPGDLSINSHNAVHCEHELAGGIRAGSYVGVVSQRRAVLSP